MARCIIVCTKCGEERPLEAKGLCGPCYKKEHAKNYKRPEIVCSKCGKQTDKYTKDLCSNCYNTQRWAEGKCRGPEVECKRCGKIRSHAAHGLCAPCHSTEYRKNNNYKGPMGMCDRCGLEKNIHAKGMCSNCYNKEYNLSHKEERRQYIQEQRKLNPEKFRKWGKNWADNNKDRRRELDQNFRDRNRERLRMEKRLRYRTNPEIMEKARLRSRLYSLKPGMVITKRQILSVEAKLTIEINKIPDLKRVWVAEFLASAFADRAPSTKYRLVCDIRRLVKHLGQRSDQKANAGWNALELSDIDQCQVDTGILKDSLRVFFRWLKRRKYITLSLADAIPVPKNRSKASKVSKTFLRELFDKWNQGEGTIHTCIAGLLIIYFGMTNEELRNLKVTDLRESKVFLGGEWLEIDPVLWDKIIAYLKWREEFYFGMAPEYFFVTGISVSNNKPVCISYFSNHFKLNNILVTPGELRKAMIYFHKRYSKMNPALIASLFRISPKGAAQHFKQI